LSILNYVQYFFAGFLLCDLYLTDWDRIPAHWLWDVVSIGAWCWIFQADGRPVHVLLPVAALVAYIGAFKGVLFPKFFRTSWVSLTGGMCYSIYLTHNLAIAGVDLVFRRVFTSPLLSPSVKDLIAYGASVSLAFCVGLALYVTVERPCMDKNWPMKLWQRLHEQR
jgi:peptidoglycan/LPS O-acetylase OafA/YrhL